jgi:hypothetical protein
MIGKQNYPHGFWKLEKKKFGRLEIEKIHTFDH